LAYGGKGDWEKAAADAQECVKKDPSFVKGASDPPPPAPRREIRKRAEVGRREHESRENRSGSISDEQNATETSRRCGNCGNCTRAACRTRCHIHAHTQWHAFDDAPLAGYYRLATAQVELGQFDTAATTIREGLKGDSSM
jgi:hypothetical protein